MEFDHYTNEPEYISPKRTPELFPGLTPEQQERVRKDVALYREEYSNLPVWGTKEDWENYLLSIFFPKIN